MDQDFRMMYLFQGEGCQDFIREFSERRPQMLQFLGDLEDNAVQLDRMNKGAKISSVAGSSVGAVGGVLSIVGLALIPFTAGASLALTMTGLGLGITSGVNSAVTTATEIGVNRKHQNKAKELFQSFMEDVQVLQDALEGFAPQKGKDTDSDFQCEDTVYKEGTTNLDIGVGALKAAGNVGAVGRSIDGLVDGVSAVKLLKTEQVATGAGKVLAQEAKAFRNVPRVASELPDIGQAGAKGTLALSKSARGGLIAVNALFLGMDVFFICKDSVSLYRGSETVVSKVIRARAALWRSELDSWQKIHDSVQRGRPAYDKNHEILDSPF